MPMNNDNPLKGVKKILDLQSFQNSRVKERDMYGEKKMAKPSSSLLLT